MIDTIIYNKGILKKIIKYLKPSKGVLYFLFVLFILTLYSGYTLVERFNRLSNIRGVTPKMKEIIDLENAYKARTGKYLSNISGSKSIFDELGVSFDKYHIIRNFAVKVCSNESLIVSAWTNDKDSKYKIYMYYPNASNLIHYENNYPNFIYVEDYLEQKLHNKVPICPK